MDQKQKLEIFRAQVENVRELDSAWRYLKRTINADLVKNNQQSALLHTKLLALTYCAWSEALFSKVIHTPYGFDLSEIDQIKEASRTEGIVSGWRKCIELALRQVDATKSNHVPNLKQALERLVREFIEGPSLIRNKIAHGQLKVALNRENTNINPDLTKEISDLNVVKLDRLHTACSGLAEIVESIIESPQKGAHREYWIISARIQEELARTENFTLEEKVSRLKQKKRLSHNPPLN